MMTEKISVKITEIKAGKFSDLEKAISKAKVFAETHKLENLEFFTSLADDSLKIYGYRMETPEEFKARVSECEMRELKRVEAAKQLLKSKGIKFNEQ